jgi:acetyl-CoA carboxylase biotin carboxyl carrier protein
MAEGDVEQLVRELARLIEETGLGEIEVERDGLRLRVARPVQAAHAGAPLSAVPPPPMIAPAPAVPAPLDPAKHPGLVTSPMVGTAYLAPEPAARPFVDIGSVVKAGDTLLIIEAMKTHNQIPAPRAGTVIQILVDDGQPVEFGEPLMILQ